MTAYAGLLEEMENAAAFEPVTASAEVNDLNNRVAAGWAKALPLEERLAAKYEQAGRGLARRARRRYERAQPVIAAARPPNWLPQPDEVVTAEDAAAAAARTQAQRRAIVQAMVGSILGVEASRDAVFRALIEAQAGRQAERLVEGSRDAVARVILDAQVEGWGVPQTAEAIQTELEAVSRWQSVMLARTDLISLSNASSVASASLLGADAPPLKVWLATSDNRTRPDHHEAEGQTVPVDQSFTVGGESLAYPGDPNGSDGNTINCRCTVRYAWGPNPGFAPNAISAAFSPSQPRYQPGVREGGRWRPESGEGTLDDLVARHPDVEVWASDHGDGITLHMIRTRPGARGTGAASRALRDLTAMADRRGVPMWLTPEAVGDDAPMSTDQLARWYRRHGWASANESGLMRREPSLTAAFNPALHPRRPSGDEHGGEWALKETAVPKKALEDAALGKTSPSGGMFPGNAETDGSTNGELEAAGVNQPVMGGRYKAWLLSRGYSGETVNEVNSLFSNWSQGGEAQTRARGEMLAALEGDGQTGRALRETVSLNTDLYETWRNGAGFERARQTGRDKLYRAGGRGELIQSWTTNPEGASPTAATNPGNRWEPESTEEWPTLRRQGWRIIGGVAQLTGAPGEAEITLVNLGEVDRRRDPAVTAATVTKEDEMAELTAAERDWLAQECISLVNRARQLKVNGGESLVSAGTGEPMEAIEVPLGEVGVLVASAPVAPPEQWFQDPGLTEPTPLTVTPEGRVFGHLAQWGRCHTGIGGRCVIAPRSQTGYEAFHTGSVLTDSGKQVRIGKITARGPHADLNMSGMQAASHYDHSAMSAAYVRAGEDEHGPWLAGAVRSDATPEQIAELRAHPPSGDWRQVGPGGALELVAALAVPVPGFPVAAIAASGAHEGEVTALIMGFDDRQPLALAASCGCDELEQLLEDGALAGLPEREVRMRTLRAV